MFCYRVICVIMLFLSSSVLAVEEDSFKPLKPKQIDWSFNGVFGKFDLGSAQRGLKVYREVCAACHSLQRIAFRNLTEIGFSKEQAKAIAASYNITDGPNDDGEYYERPGTLSDYFPSPFPNKEAAAAANNGAVPPDLSLMVKARHDGANYIYSLLTGYKSNDPIPGTNLYENPYFVTGTLAMMPPLSDSLVTYDDDTESTIHHMSYDTVNFLQWAAEPEMEKRKSVGIKVIFFLSILFVVMFIAKKQIWRDLDKE